MTGKSRTGTSVILMKESLLRLAFEHEHEHEHEVDASESGTADG
jgi:hypothetical protein